MSLRRGATAVLAATFAWILAPTAALEGQQDTSWVQRGLDELYSADPGRANFERAATIFDSARVALAGRQGETRAIEFLAEAQFWGRLDGLDTTLWLLTDAGRAADASELAARALSDTSVAFVGLRPELLVAFAGALSRQFYDPGEFLASPTAAAIQQPTLMGDAAVAPGIRQLLSWHGQGAESTPQGPNVWELPDLESIPACYGQEWSFMESDPRRWSWWHDPVGSNDGMPESGDAAPTGAEPRNRSRVARSLLRTLGSWYGQRDQAGDRARAATYLCIASVLDEAFILPLAFRDLLWNYLDAERPDLARDLHRRDRYRSHMHGADRDYLSQIEDALSFHRRWPWLVVGGGGLVAIACAVEFVICESDPPITIVVTVP